MGRLRQPQTVAASVLTAAQIPHKENFHQRRSGEGCQPKDQSFQFQIEFATIGPDSSLGILPK